jgi:acyl carrier protein
MDKEKITGAIYAAIDEVNQLRPKDQRLAKSSDTVLLGKSGQLDSLGVVNFIVATEMNIEEEFGISVNLADDKAMSQENSPFRTVGTFADYISNILAEKIV